MRFRKLQITDVPDVARLYGEYLEDRLPDECPYPYQDERSIDEFSLGLVRQLTGNPHWFGFVAVVGSKIVQDPQGQKHVVGGKAKGIIAVNLTERPIGEPKRLAFIELAVVDRKFRRRGILRRLAQLCFIEGQRRGVETFEAAWTPGSKGEEFWPAVGLRPYRVLGAYILKDGTLRTDFPSVSGTVEASGNAPPEPAGEDD